jgi:hypothetical protein
MLPRTLLPEMCNHQKATVAYLLIHRDVDDAIIQVLPSSGGTWISHLFGATCLFPKYISLHAKKVTSTGYHIAILQIICIEIEVLSLFFLSFLGSTAQLRPWPPPQNPAEFLGCFSTIFFFTG